MSTLLKHQGVSELRSPNITSITGTNSNTPNVNDKTFDNNPESENVFDILKKIRIKNVNNIIFATLNVNSFPSIFD